MITIRWSAAPLIHTAFWILVKPLHLKSMVRKSMRCTENCNACSQHWSTEMAQFFSRTTSDCTVAQPKLQGLNELGYEVLPHLSWFTRPCTNQLRLLQASHNFLHGKRFHHQHKAENAFQEFVNSRSMDFYTREINKLILIGKKVLIMIAPILTNKDVFESSYNDLKFTVQNFNYVCANWISFTPSMTWWEKQSIFYKPGIIMRRYQTNPNWGAVYKIPDQYSSKV